MIAHDTAALFTRHGGRRRREKMCVALCTWKILFFQLFESIVVAATWGKERVVWTKFFDESKIHNLLTHPWNGLLKKWREQIDENAKVSGIISERDYVCKIALLGKASKDTTVSTRIDRKAQTVVCSNTGIRNLNASSNTRPEYGASPRTDFFCFEFRRSCCVVNIPPPAKLCCRTIQPSVARLRCRTKTTVSQRP